MYCIIRDKQISIIEEGITTCVFDKSRALYIVNTEIVAIEITYINKINKINKITSISSEISVSVGGSRSYIVEVDGI